MRSVFSWLERHPYVADAFLAAIAFLVFAIVDAYRSGPSAVVPDALFALAVAFWRRSPALGLTIAWIGALLQLVAQPSVIFGNALIALIVFATGLSERRPVRWAGFWSSILGGLVAGVKLVLVTDILLPDDRAVAPDGSSRLLYFAGVSVVIASALALFWALGVATRTRRALATERWERLESEKERLRAELRVAQETERTRITREMHDAIGHSLAVVIAQSDGARYALQSNPRAAADALEIINRSARGALDDVNSLLNVLASGDGTSRPFGVRDLDAMIAEMQASGLSVARTETGRPRELSTALDLAVYRVVQESLTNALKHGGPGTRVSLAVDWDGDGIRIESATTEPHRGTALVPARPSRSGRGIVGMRERVRLIDGALEAGATSDGFRVVARIPYEGGH